MWTQLSARPSYGIEHRWTAVTRPPNICPQVTSPVLCVLQQRQLGRWRPSGQLATVSLLLGVRCVCLSELSRQSSSSLPERVPLAVDQRPIERASTSTTTSGAAASRQAAELSSSSPVTGRLAAYLAARVFGAKKSALKCERRQRAAAASDSLQLSSVALSLSNCMHRSHFTRSSSPVRCVLDQFTSHRRYLSSYLFPMEPSTINVTKSSESSSLFDSSESEPESLESSLPALSESGHRQYQVPTAPLSSIECTKYLKSPPEKKVYRIVVEGNIGSGKTTFLKIFSKNCTSLLNKPLIVPEPIDLWRDVGGVNIFQLLADDPKRWSFAFQSYVQLTMVKIHEMHPDEGNFKVMERSLFSARYCFVENLLRKGLLEPCEYYILDEWFKASLPSAPVDLIIYLRSDPDVVYERIKQRGRPEELGITLEYLRALHELHEDWLVHGKYPLPAEVLTIDANTPLDQIVSVYEEKTGGILREHMVTA